jgi:small-conductance mechanosensitive channel
MTFITNVLSFGLGCFLGEIIYNLIWPKKRAIEIIFNLGPDTDMREVEDAVRAAFREAKVEDGK